jgi:dTDP-glucose 4,6-dehydratase
LYRSSHNKREWLHVDDHCRAIELILRRGDPGETYNVGSGDELDIEAIAHLVLATLELDDTYKTYVPDRPGHDRRYLLDSTKIRRTLGWYPRIATREGIIDAVLWYKNNRHWWEPLLANNVVNEDGWNGPRTLPIADSLTYSRL